MCIVADAGTFARRGGLRLARGNRPCQHDETGQLLLADHDYQADEQHQFDANGNLMGDYVLGSNNRQIPDGTFDGTA